MVAVFYRMGLDTNLENTKSMVCTPGFIWGKWSEKAYKLWSMGLVFKFGGSKRMQVSCTEFGVTVAVSCLKQHMAQLHGICVPQTRYLDDGR